MGFHLHFSFFFHFGLIFTKAAVSWFNAYIPFSARFENSVVLWASVSLIRMRQRKKLPRNRGPSDWSKYSTFALGRLAAVYCSKRATFFHFRRINKFQCMLQWRKIIEKELKQKTVNKTRMNSIAQRVSLNVSVAGSSWVREGVHEQWGMEQSTNSGNCNQVFLRKILWRSQYIEFLFLLGCQTQKTHLLSHCKYAR